MIDAGSNAPSERSFELPYPQLSPAQAQEIVAAHWSLGGQIDEVGSTQDQNFRVSCPAGRRFVFKVASPLWSRAELELQNAAMDHLAAGGRSAGWPHAALTDCGTSSTPHWSACRSGTPVAPSRWSMRFARGSRPPRETGSRRP